MFYAIPVSLTSTPSKVNVARKLKHNSMKTYGESERKLPCIIGLTKCIKLYNNLTASVLVIPVIFQTGKSISLSFLHVSLNVSMKIIPNTCF